MHLVLMRATALLLTLAPTLALASPSGRPQVAPPVVWGEGCPDAGTVQPSLTETAPGQFTYGLVLSRLDAATVLPSIDHDYRDCSVEVGVTPPPGWQMRIARVILQGRHDAPSHATTTKVQSTYRMRFDEDGTRSMRLSVDTNKRLRSLDLQGGLRIVQHDGIGTSRGNWTLAVDTNDAQWSPCGEPLTLEGELIVEAQSDDLSTDAEIAVQRSDVQTNRGLAWGWQLRRCDGSAPGSFHGRWSSQYEALNGQVVQATIDVSGGRGTYRTPHFLGSLDQIRANGREITGRWSASGTSGWFRFTLAADGSRFDGTYGVGNAQQVRGRWWGRR